MSTYAIGDIQGCFAELQALLEKIQFDKAKDILWFTGDLVNRGIDSLKTLRFIKSLGDRVVCVLGNHDLGMLAIARGAEPFDPAHHTFSDVLQADDKEELLLWLESLPLLYHDDKIGYTLVHAGFHPAWDLEQAKKLAKELETVLRSSEKYNFYPHLYGNTPDTWNEGLQGYERLRFIVNSFTRLRFCTPGGRLDFKTTDLNKKPAGFLPWYEIPNRKSRNLNILFGHWAALEGKVSVANVFPLDTGCVWGKSLSAFRLEDMQVFSVSCKYYEEN